MSSGTRINSTGNQANARLRNAIVYNPAPHDVNDNPTGMLDFLRLLQHRYSVVLGQLPSGDSLQRQSFRRLQKSLAFSEAVLEKGDLIGRHPDHPCHIAILGPTQAGKSSVVNWLLGGNLAEVSPLAGYTVHPQGFAQIADTGRLDELSGYFRCYLRTHRGELNHGQLDCYSLDTLTSDESTGLLQDCVVWDTPDFDSVHADEYRDAVLRVAALADIIVLVVSKDKYADLSVWEFMSLLASLTQPTLIVLNKTDAESAERLPPSLREKWRTRREDEPAYIEALPYLPAGRRMSDLEDERTRLLHHLQKLRLQVKRQDYPQRARSLIKYHWPNWTYAIHEEHRLSADWDQRVCHALHDSLDRYQRDYLNHPLHYETFQRALAELLTLLEIPGLGGTLLAARRAVTWPVRQLTRWGRRHRQDADRQAGEAAVLNQLAEQALTHINESLLLNAGETIHEQTWWRHLNGQLLKEKPVLLAEFGTATRAYMMNFQPEIEKTAQHLYEHLKKSPAVLNTLRATRVTTDAAALAIALHTGGIGVQDLVIAPAMLSLTSLLTESALGRYMYRASEQLKRTQLTQVEALFESKIRQPLANLPRNLDSDSRLDISPDTLAVAESRLHQ
jgi:GTP-binding protein EngB required for normal cell division